MSYGIIEYNAEGLPKCEVCGKHFSRVLTHVRQKHYLTEREYKIMYGFDLIKGIVSEQSRAKSRQAVIANFDTAIKENLIAKGEASRFKKGTLGRTSDQVSEQTKLALVERAKNSLTPEARRLNGKELGLSGKGNQTRWGTKS